MRLEVRHCYCGRFALLWQVLLTVHAKIGLLVNRFHSYWWLLFSVPEGHCHWDIVRHATIANINEFDCRVSGMGQLWPVRAVHN